MVTTVAENWLPKQPQNYLVKTLLPRNFKKKQPNLVIPYKNEVEGGKIDGFFFLNQLLRHFKTFFYTITKDFLKGMSKKKKKNVFLQYDLIPGTTTYRKTPHMMEMMQRKSCARNRKLINLVICVCHQGQILIYKKHLFGASLAPELQHHPHWIWGLLRSHLQPAFLFIAGQGFTNIYR